MRGSRKFCQRGSNFDNVFFKLDPSPTLSGPSSARQRIAIKLCFAGMPMNAQHRMLAAIFQGIRTCIARKPCIFVIFRGGGEGGSGPPVPPLVPHM